MARLNTYPNDENVSGSDKVIGTDANTGGTKNFTLSSVSNWMNDAGAVKILGQSNYVFQGDGAAPRRVATISVEDYSNNVAFSDVTQLIFSQNPAGGHDIVPYLNAIIGKKIIIGNLTYLENFGIYTLFSVEEFEPGFYTLELGFVEGSGALYDEGSYGFAPWALEPLDALDLQDVTDIGNTTTHSITTGGLDVTGINRITIGDATNYFGGGGLQIGGAGFSAAKMHLITSTTGTGSITFGDGAYGDTLQGIISYDHSSNAMYFVTARYERLRIDGSGNVGIGTTSPAYLLDVNTNNIRVGVHTFGHGGSDVATNLAIGQNALAAHAGSTGSAVAIGPGALQYSTDASYSTAIGEFAGANDNGTQSTFIGAYTGPYYYALTGGYNTMVGSQAGIQMSGTAEVNTGIGNGALYNLSTGNDNTALGQSAGSGITTGSGNIMIGVGNNGVSTGSNNVIIGRFTGLASGLSNNVIIGDGAGNKRIVFNDLGELQLPDLTAGYLKSDASGNITVDTDTIEDTLDSVTNRDNTTTNSITVANITSTSGVVTMGQNKIDGSSDNLKIMSDSENVSGSSTIEFSIDGSEKMRITNTGNVGIGTTSPSYKLDVAGDVQVQSAYFLRFANEWGIQQTGTNLNFAEIGSSDGRLYLKAGGNVGIGTTNPAYKLDVNGSLHSSDITIAHTIYHEGDTNTYMQFHANDEWRVVTAGVERLEVTSPKTTVQNVLIANDFVGIGTSSPSNKLHVVGDTRIEGNLTVNGTYTQVDTDTLTTEQWNVTNDGTGPAVTINQTGAQDIMDVQDDGTSVFYIEDGGNVGIGTTNPNSKLHVSDTTDISMSAGGAGQIAIEGNGYTGAIALDATAMHIYHNSANRALVLGTNETAAITIHKNNQSLDLNAYGSGAFTGTAAYALAVDSSGNVIETAVQSSPTGGSGTTNYVAKWNTSSTLGDSSIYDDGTNVGIGTNDFGASSYANWNNLRLGKTANLFFNTSANTYGFNIGRNFYFASDASYKYLTSDKAETIVFSAGNIDFNNAASGTEDNALTWSTRMRIAANGNVGIGTTSPTEKLHVEGNIKLLSTTGSGLFFVSGSAPSGVSWYSQPGTADGTQLISYGSAHVIIDSDNNDADTRFFTIRKNGTNYSNSAELLRVTEAGNVGIGTTSPSYKLDVVDGQFRVASTVDDIAFLNTTSTSPNVYIRSSNTGVGNVSTLYFSPSANIGTSYIRGIAVGDSSTTGNRTGAIQFGVRNANIWNDSALYIKENGNVGIGTTAPSTKLQVSGGNGDTPATALFSIQKNEEGYGLFSGILGSGVSWLQSATKTQSSYYGLTLQPNGGNVGIGTTSPAYKLEVDGGNAGNSLFVNGYVNGSAYGISNRFVLNSATRIWFYDSNAQIYRDYNTLRITGNDGIALETNANERVRINSSGNVGIGTTTPSKKLHIALSNSSHADEGIILESNSGYGQGLITHDYNQGNGLTAFKITNGYTGSQITLSQDSYSSTGSPGSIRMYTSFSGGANTPVERMRIAANGNVGIGTTSPARKLAVNSGGTNIVASFASTDAYAGISLSDNTTSSDSSVQLRAEGDNLHLVAGSNDRMTITDAGNIGIGTTSPGSKLYIGTYSVAGSYIDSSTLPTTPANHLITLTPPSTANYYGGGIGWSEGTNVAASINAYDAGSGGALGIVLSTGDNTTLSERMRITNTGNVGIGTTIPNSRLNVKSSGSNTDEITLTHSGNTVNIVAIGQESSHGSLLLRANSGVNKVRLSAAGNNSYILDSNVGIGTTSPSEKLHVVGKGLFDGTRDIFLDTDNGSITIQPNSGGWSTGYHFKNVSGTFVGGYGLYGSGDTLNYFWIGDDYNDATMVIKPNAGNVGIGTTAPADKLEVQDGNIRIEQVGNTDAKLIFNPYSSALGTTYQWELAGGNAANNYNFQIRENGTTYVTVDSSVNGNAGFVGIGTTSPAQKLHLKNNGDVAIALENQSDTSGNYWALWQDNWNGNSNFTFNIAYGGTNFLTVKTDGNVGIGTTSPGEKLVIAGGVLAYGNTSSFGSGTSYFLGNNPSSRDIAFTRVANAELGIGRYNGGWFETMRFNANGNVGIGTTSPAAKLVVAGTAYINQTSDYFGIANTKVQISAGSSSDNVGIRSDKLYLYSYANGTDSQLIFGDGQAHWALFANDNRFSLYNYATSATSIHVSNPGNVGIGTTSPQAKFHAIGHTMFSGGGYSTAYNSQNGLVIDSSNITSAASTYGSGIEFTRLGDSTIKKAGIVPVQETADSDSIGLSFHTARTTTTTDPTFEVMRLSHDSKVGIGSSSPSSKLEVNGTAMSQLRMVTAGGPSSSSDTSGNIGDLAYDADHLYIKTSNGWGRVALDFAF